MFIMGFLLGCILTFFLLLIYSCLVVAKRADEQMAALEEETNHMNQL